MPKKLSIQIRRLISIPFGTGLSLSTSFKSARNKKILIKQRAGCIKPALFNLTRVILF